MAWLINQAKLKLFGFPMSSSSNTIYRFVTSSSQTRTFDFFWQAKFKHALLDKSQLVYSPRKGKFKNQNLVWIYYLPQKKNSHIYVYTYVYVYVIIIFFKFYPQKNSSNHNIPITFFNFFFIYTLYKKRTIEVLVWQNDCSNVKTTTKSLKRNKQNLEVQQIL